MKAFIYTGGAIDPQNITEHPKGDDLVIAADSGYDNATALGEKPTVLLGDMDSIKSSDIPEGVETIEENAFTSCTGLQTVVLPSTLKTIEDSAFDKADNLVVIFFKGTEEEFDALEISNNNASLISSKVYFYSETEPSEKGDFWHYDKGNTPVLW